jgi:integrase
VVGLFVQELCIGNSRIVHLLAADLLRLANIDDLPQPLGFGITIDNDQSLFGKEERYPKFSNDVVAYMSAVFRESKDARRRSDNPALGVKRLYKPGVDANRRWKDKEWEKAFALAPAHLRAPLAIARWCGLRGQDIAALTWANYRDDPDMVKVLAFVPQKNGDKVGEITIGVPDELQTLLNAMKAGDGVVQPASNSPICRNSLGKQFPSENAMRKAWQDFKQGKPFKAALPTSQDLTLHGLRVTFASELREQGFSDREVADMLGDLSESMGKHYGRGAAMRRTSVRVHQRRKNAL